MWPPNKIGCGLDGLTSTILRFIILFIALSLPLFHGVLKKILKMGSYVSRWGGWNEFLKLGVKFDVRKTYRTLLGPCVKMPWRGIICSNKASPRAIFITWLILHGKLNTAVRITKWNAGFDDKYRICGKHLESIDHLFYHYEFISAVRAEVFQFLEHPIDASSFQ